MSTETKVSFDRLDANTYWHPLPPRTLAEVMSGEAPSLFVTRVYGKWWVGLQDRAPSAGPFEQLDEAFTVGEKQIDEAWARQSAELATQGGLDATQWTWSDEEKSFIRADSPLTQIVVLGPNGPFRLFDESMDMGDHPTLKAASDAYDADVPAPSRL